MGRRSRSAWRPLSVAAFVDCCEEWPNATLRRQASKVAAWLLPARPGPCSRLCLLGEVMCTTGYDRLPHRCCVGSTSASTAFDLHARPRASLGSLQPSPGPHKPILSTHPLLPPKLFSLIISPPRPHHSTSTSPITPTSSPILDFSPRSCFLSQQVTLLNLFPRRRFCFCCWVRANCCSPDSSLPETSAHLQAHLRHLARPSSLLPALAFSTPTSKFTSTTSSLSACRHSLAVFDSTRRLYSSDPIVHSCSPAQSIACPSATPLLTLLFVSFCKSPIRQCCSSRTLSACKTSTC